MNCLITGATGTVGGLVVEILLSRGIRPHVFARDESKARARFGGRVDVAVGDLSEPATLGAALRGIDSLFLVNAGPDLALRDEGAARAAKAAGVKHIVKLSTMDVEQEVGTGVWHARGEAAIRASGVPFTFVRPSGFMLNALSWGMPIRGDGVVRCSTGEGKIPFIHQRDIAEVSVAALTMRSLDGYSLAITGPEALSYGEMVAKIGDVVGKALKYESLSDDAERQRWAARGETKQSIDYHLSIFRAIREGRLATVTDTVLRVLGRPAISFDTWVRENVAEFR